MEFGIYLPQVGFDYPQLLERARAVEEFGFDSLWLFDHLAFGGPAVPVYEAWTTATALLAQTASLRVGHLVLCANFRHPVLLGKMVNTLSAIAPGRLLLGLGSGSIPSEHELIGLPWGSFGERTRRLAETLEIVTRMTHGRSTRFDGQFFSVGEVPNLPAPLVPPPVVIGGKGERTLDLVARYADWWNCPTYALGELESLSTSLAGACRRIGRDPAAVGVSTQSVLALVADEADVPAARALAERRFGGPMWRLDESGYIGTPATVLPQLQEAVDLGVRSFVFFLHDRVTRSTLRLLADEVVAPLRRSNGGDAEPARHPAESEIST